MKNNIIDMNYVILIILFVLIFFSFIYGMSVVHFEIFPFDFIKKLKISVLSNNNSIDDNSTIYENDFNSLIRFSTEDELLNTRSELTNYIWKHNLPKNIIPQVDSNIYDSNYVDLKNLKKIDRITTVMDFEINSISYLFVAEQSNNKLIIYHQGHSGNFLNGKNTIEFFLNKGYSVLAFSMPLLGMNNQPMIDSSNFGTIQLTSHNHFKFINSINLSPIKFFVEPIFLSLNYVDKQFDFESYNFVGLSGGGWTAIIYSAIDDRISDTYSIAGSVPISYRSIQKNFGDYEQTLPELYNIANYFELYLLSSYGDSRKLLQVFNKYDPCCFSGDYYIAYESVLQKKLSDLNGDFEIFIDDTHKEHTISDSVLYLIDKSITPNLP